MSGLHVLIVRCADCGSELNRTKPVEPEAIGWMWITRDFQDPCKNGCSNVLKNGRVTNTTYQIVDAP